MAKTIRRETVEVVRERWECPKQGCGGDMRETSGMVRASHPPQYPHRCSECGFGKYAKGECYPRIVHRERADTTPTEGETT